MKKNVVGILVFISVFSLSISCSEKPSKPTSRGKEVISSLEKKEGKKDWVCGTPLEFWKKYLEERSKKAEKK